MPLTKRDMQKTHSLVDCLHRRRPYCTIRIEVIASARNFLEQRLDSEQEGIMKNIKKICGAKSPTDFIDSSRPFLECAGISGGQVKEFSDTVFKTFHDFKPSSDILRKDYSIKILHMLRNSSGLVKDRLSAIVVVSPDSMKVERSFSTYIILYSKLSSSTNQIQ